MRPIEIKRDGTLAKAYFAFALISLVISGYKFLIANNSDHGRGILVLTAFFLFVAAYLADLRPLFLIDEEGVKPKWKSKIYWSRVFTIDIKRKSFNNKFFTKADFTDKDEKVICSITLDRHNIGGEELQRKLEELLNEAHQDHITIAPYVSNK
jgi:hypothetical protein